MPNAIEALPWTRRLFSLHLKARHYQPLHHKGLVIRRCSNVFRTRPRHFCQPEAATRGRLKPHRRTFFTDSLPAVVVPPVLFTGLLLTLWTYKCMMTVLFQDKIIYMPYMPPFARSQKIDEYTAICKPVQWKHRSIRSLDGTRLSICIGKHAQQAPSDTVKQKQNEVVICYFHGNGSAVPPRLPLLSGVLRAIHARTSDAVLPAQYTIIALSYRGYWTSAGRASQAGIEKDSQALLRWISTEYASDKSGVQLLLWGQSIGAGVASTATATWLSQSQLDAKPSILGLILETPFTSIKSMLLALYPQKWLPYQYLWPFLWNHWDTELALQQIAQTGKSPQILLMPATRDEVVPAREANKLENLCRQLQLPMIRKNVIGALHTDATVRQDGQDIVAKFVVDVTESRKGRQSNSKVDAR